MRGDLSSSDGSKKLDKLVKQVAKSICEQNLSNFHFEQGHKHSNFDDSKIQLREFVKLGLKKGFLPDGGLWFDKPRYDKNGYANDDRQCKFVFEAKYQGNRGNAHQRLSDSFNICQIVYPNAKFITFMAGEGCIENGVLTIFAKDNKILHGDKIDFHLKREGFEYEDIYNLMLKYLNNVE